jgi:hypothetical protein
MVLKRTVWGVALQQGKNYERVEVIAVTDSSGGNLIGTPKRKDSKDI